MFITLEGGEGAGKSTQAATLAAGLRRAGHSVLLTREPGGAPGAELIRETLLHGPVAFTPEAETLLHFAARFEHLTRAILPALAAGSIVVCDRFTDSTLAYQGYGHGVAPARIAALAAMLPAKPDITFILDVSPEVAALRLAARSRPADRYETLDDGFHARVREGFRAIARAEPERCRRIDADADPATVAAAIRAALAALGIRTADPP
jgi:dTMP kinase